MHTVLQIMYEVQLTVFYLQRSKSCVVLTTDVNLTHEGLEFCMGSWELY